MGGDDNGDMGFQLRGEGMLNCPSSGMNTNPMSEKVSGMAMSTVSMFKSSSGGDPFFASGWDPLVSLSQSENFGGSSMVSHCEFVNSPYPAVIENQGISSTSHIVQYPPSDSSLVDLVPKLPCFGSGSFSEMVGSFGLPECGQTANTGCPQNYSPNKEGGTGKTSPNRAHSQEDCQISDEGTLGASPNGKRRKRVLDSHSPFNSNKNAEGDQQKDLSGESTDFSKEQDEKKHKIEQNTGANLRGKQTGKQAKDNSQSGEGLKDNYIHVRARRGQATNSHSLAERVRREKISERMRMLQELVPGCNKITGKAVMLDEIINYVQSLQQQVEFLSMKLATINPELNIDIERILSKDILHSRSGSATILGIRPGMNSSHPYQHGIIQGTLPGIPSTTPQFFPMPQTIWDNELQNLLQMGFDSNQAIDNLGPNGRSKSEL
ncbi:hypothetical protein L1049_026621 [Liquidambar formosana]|uniref:BHLH domain-containing protein n=1 Tax=Liquidambar formosana TaxID=63359 RepID=A0AAP0R5K6_LIQFO